MPPITRVGAPSIEQRQAGVLVTIPLSEPPDRNWKRDFKEGGIFSILGLTNALFEDSEVLIEMAREQDLRELMGTVDRCIDRANQRNSEGPPSDKRII